jgi:hypothetical protein
MIRREKRRVIASIGKAQRVLLLRNHLSSAARGRSRIKGAEGCLRSHFKRTTRSNMFGGFDGSSCSGMALPVLAWRGLLHFDSVPLTESSTTRPMPTRRKKLVDRHAQKFHNRSCRVSRCKQVNLDLSVTGQCNCVNRTVPEQ